MKQYKQTLLITFISTLLISIIITGTSVPVSAKHTLPSIPCDAYILLDLDTGKVLASKNPTEKIYPASTTKIMTAMLAAELSPPNKVMTASYDALLNIGAGGMHIGISTGEKMKFKDLLKAVLLSSANEASNIIAESSSSSRQKFIKLMNKKAKEIGANNTNFINCHGMFSTQHYSTVSDLATIARYALTESTGKDLLLKTASISPDEYKLPKTNKHKKWYGLPFSNHLYEYESKQYDQILGLKTGYINQSGHNFVGVVSNKKGVRLLSVICGVTTRAHYNSVFYYTNKLMNYGYKTDYVKARNKEATAAAKAAAESLINNSMDSSIKSNPDIPENIPKNGNDNDIANPAETSSRILLFFVYLSFIISAISILYNIRKRVIRKRSIRKRQFYNSSRRRFYYDNKTGKQQGYRGRNTGSKRSA